MDIIFFLRERTKFIWYFYETASNPFAKTMTDIEEQREPYIPPYSEDSEPAFMSEWSAAREGLDACGHQALSMLAATLKLFLQMWVARLDRDHGMRFKVKKKKGLLDAYVEILKEVGLNIESCPADINIIEQITLVRNRVQHPESITTNRISHSQSDLEKHPNPFFSDGMTQPHFSLMTVSATKEQIQTAIENVERFCCWLEFEYWNARKAMR